MSHTRSREYVCSDFLRLLSETLFLNLGCTADSREKEKGLSTLFVTELLAIDFAMGCVSSLNPHPSAQRAGNIVSHIVLLCTTGPGFSREPREVGML